MRHLCNHVCKFARRKCVLAFATFEVIGAFPVECAVCELSGVISIVWYLNVDDCLKFTTISTMITCAVIVKADYWPPEMRNRQPDLSNLISAPVKVRPYYNLEQCMSYDRMVRALFLYISIDIAPCTR